MKDKLNRITDVIVLYNGRTVKCYGDHMKFRFILALNVYGYKPSLMKIETELHHIYLPVLEKSVLHVVSY